MCGLHYKGVNKNINTKPTQTHTHTQTPQSRQAWTSTTATFASCHLGTDALASCWDCIRFVGTSSTCFSIPREGEKGEQESKLLPFKLSNHLGKKSFCGSWSLSLCFDVFAELAHDANERWDWRAGEASTRGIFEVCTTEK